MITQSVNSNHLKSLHRYWKEEQAERKWKLISDTEEERQSAIRQGAMFFTWAALSEPYNGNGQPEPNRIGDLPLDFDSKEDPSRALQELKQLCLVYLPEMYDLDPYSMRFFASGSKGFHAEIPAELVGAQTGDPQLPILYKRIVAHWAAQLGLETLDLSIYSMGKGKMWRLPNVKRSNGRYKVPLGLEEVRDLPFEEIWKLTEAPREIEQVEVDLSANEDLGNFYRNVRAEIYEELSRQKKSETLSEEQRTKLAEKVPPCIEHIISKQPKKSDHVNFNKLVVNLVSYFQAAGFARAAAFQAVEGFLRQYPHSETYDTADKRLKHWETIWRFYEGSDYVFACSYILGLHLPGNAFDCQQCPQTQSKESEWETPTDLTRSIPEAPPFPLDCLPYVVANYAKDESQRMQSPVDLIAIPILVTMAGLIGKGATIRPKAKDDWSERPCVWAMIIAHVSSMKSANLSKATAPLRRIQKGLSERYNEEIKEWKEADKQFQMRMKAWEKECQRTLKKDQNAKLPPRPQITDPILLNKPSQCRIITNDATIEKNADLQATSRGMSLVRDELAGFLLNMSRYNSGSDRQYYLECYSGGAYAVDRVSRGEQFVDDLYLNIGGNIQPDVARKLFSLVAGADDGFSDRFGLRTYPENKREYKHVDRWPNKDKRDLFNDMCDRLAEADWTKLLITDDFSPKPFARFDGEAQALFDEWLVNHMNELVSIPEDNPMAGMMGKARGLLVRLILVIHLAAWAAGEMPEAQTITKLSLDRAMVLLEQYLIPMWERIFAAFGKTAADDGATKIAKWIKEEKLDKVRFRDIRQKHWAGLLDDKEIQAAIDMLIANRWLGEVEKVSKGGRPSVVYPVNPLVHETFEKNEVSKVPKGGRPPIMHPVNPLVHGPTDEAPNSSSKPPKAASSGGFDFNFNTVDKRYERLIR